MRRIRPSRLLFGIAILVVVTVMGVAAYQTRPLRHVAAPPTEPVLDPPPATSGSSEKRLYPFHRVVAVVVGINHHPHLSGAVDLACAEADARAVGDVFTRKYGYEVVALLGRDATKVAVETSIRKYARELGEGDALLVFFAGHGQLIELPGGGDAGYLIPVDARLDLNDRADPHRWAQQALDMHGLTELMDQANCQHVLFIADACCSGYMTMRGRLDRWDLKSFLAAKSRTVLTATNGRQLARESRLEKHGYFTAALLGQLEKDDAASVFDVYYPLYRVVREKTNGTMSPQLAQVGEGEGMFVFVPLSIPKDEIETDLNGEGVHVAARDTGFAGVANRMAALARQRTTYAHVLEALDASDYRFSADAETRGRDWELKVERFKRNALTYDVWAMAALSLCYEKGLGVKTDAGHAYHWAKLADRAGDSAGVGRYVLGRCYEYGTGVVVVGKVAQDQARRLYAASAAAGFGPGHWALGRAIMNGTPAPGQEEQKTARQCFEKAVAEGVLTARVDLARALLDNQGGLGLDQPRALQLLDSAAAGGCARAHHQLYVVYTEGKPGYPSKDEARALQHLIQAAEGGWVGAQVDLGNEYSRQVTRLNLTSDFDKAFPYFDRAAQRGDPVGLVQSARFLALGLGTRKDPVEARARLEQAVRCGSALADRFQGDWYLNGNVYPPSEELALAAYVRAADKGSQECALRAGRMYFEGKGFKPAGGRKDGSLHDDWHRGLHYFAVAHQVGGLGGRDLKHVETTLVKYVDFLEGGEFSISLDRKLREWGRGPIDGGFRTNNGNKTGERGQRRPVQFRSGEGGVVTVAGDLITRSTDVGKSWRRDYPLTFRYFCDGWAVDPKSVEVINKKQAE